MADTSEARAVGIEVETQRQFEIDAAKVRTITAESIAATVTHLLFLCKELTNNSHGRQQLRDAAELTIKAAALARLSALGGR